MANCNPLENIVNEKKPSSEISAESKAPSVSKVKYGEENVIEDRNGSNKEKSFKSPQRSMRRGSGAGSPNSQLSIPRYPAFDYSDKEDVHSLFPSPSEPEANRNIKSEIIEEAQNTETVPDSDSGQSFLRSKDPNLKKHDTGKSKTLMPELMENSETESAKGSFECEVPDLPSSSEAPSLPIPDVAFPSLPNNFLAKLGVHKDSPLPVEAFDEQELESKFIALSLAFKTDRTTLSKRLELHKRQRDMAEKNVENEFQTMRDHLNALNLKATSSDVRELITKIQYHLDIAQQATARISGRSETYGAVQQEERVSRAFEVLVLHVDHLKRLFDKEHKELEETRRMLTDTQVFKKDSGDSASEEQKKYLRSFGLPVGSIKSEAAQYTVCPFPSASSIGPSSSSLPTSPVSSVSLPKMHTTGLSVRRCSLPAAGPVAPNLLPSPEAASEESTPKLLASSSFDKQFSSRKDKAVWTRKLSSVTDEKEQSDDEMDICNSSPEENIHDDSLETENQIKPRLFFTSVSDDMCRKTSVIQSFQGTHEASGRIILRGESRTEIYRKMSIMTSRNNFEDFDNRDYEQHEPQEESLDEEEPSSTSFTSLQTIRNYAIEWLNVPAMNEIWQGDRRWTFVRRLCSLILICIAIFFLLSVLFCSINFAYFYDDGCVVNWFLSWGFIGYPTHRPPT